MTGGNCFLWYGVGCFLLSWLDCLGGGVILCVSLVGFYGDRLIDGALIGGWVLVRGNCYGFGAFVLVGDLLLL